MDVLWELPPLGTAGEAFELGWAVGIGGWTWVGDRFWVGANGVLGLELNLLPIPLDIGIEYRPSLRFAPDVECEVFDLGGHVRFYFM